MWKIMFSLSLKTWRLAISNPARPKLESMECVPFSYESCQQIRNRLTDLLGPPPVEKNGITDVRSEIYSLDSLQVFDKITFDGCRSKLVLDGLENDEFYVPAGESVSFSITTDTGRQIKNCWWIPTAGKSKLPEVFVESGVGDAIELTIVGDKNIEKYPIKVLLELGEELPGIKK